MSSEVVRIFELFGNRFEITAEFEAYNAVRSQQARDVYAIYSQYMNSINAMKEDLKHLTKKAVDDLLPAVARVNSEMAVASVGFEELKRYQSEVLPRIGKRMIFKYSKNELITVEEVAQYIRLDAEKHFTSFINEVQKVSNKEQSDWVFREYARITRNTSAVGGSIGTGMNAAAGVLAANAGMGLLQGLGGMITMALDEAELNNAKNQAVRIGIRAIFAAAYDMADQMSVYCINTIKQEMDKETANIIRKPFQEISEDRRKEIKAKSENYHNAYQKGDITSERYTTHLLSVLHDFPHDSTLYCELYQVALDINSEKDKATVLEMAQYMGLEGQMDWWLARKGFRIQTPSTYPGKDGKDGVALESVNEAPTIFQQFSNTVHCMWFRPDPSEGRPTLLFRTVGLRPDGSIWATGNTIAWDFEDPLNWRDIVSVCSICMCILFGLKSNGSVVIHGIKKENPFYQTVTHWQDIMAISGGYGHLLGLRKDGTVASALIDTSSTTDGQCDVDTWQNIVAISAGDFHSVGLRANGTVVAVGDNSSGQCNVSRWKNISAISSRGNLTVGLTREGKVIISSKDHPEGFFLSSIKNAVAISVGVGHLLVLHADGTVSATGADEFDQCKVSTWKDIVAVSAGDRYSIGVKSDGTLISTGTNESGERDLYKKIVGPYSPQLARQLREADAQSAAWKAAGLCPSCGGKISWISKRCKTCKRYVT